jgi:predicted O-methyltransferase YrrM
MPAETWSIGPAGLDFLGRRLRRSMPTSVLEFGCGDSTVYMARVLAEIHSDNKSQVISIEQDAASADECRIRLTAESSRSS